ncbi:unnamed protein product [Lasius platythorax]|uniref:Uncharacterized protein n=1 Tax=Lasius platythorax TaxID=488582 RepID=A0AAV2PBB9_9HYME
MRPSGTHLGDVSVDFPGEGSLVLILLARIKGPGLHYASATLQAHTLSLGIPYARLIMDWVNELHHACVCDFLECARMRLTS